MNPLKTGGALRCSGRESSSCSTWGICRVILVTNPVMNEKRTSLTLFFLVDAPVPIQESEWSRICLLWLRVWFCLYDFSIRFGTYPTLEYFYFSFYSWNKIRVSTLAILWMKQSWNNYFKLSFTLKQGG